MKQEQIKLAGIVRESIVDGPGMRFVVFVQGCPHRCDGCHNMSSWDCNGGYFCDISKIMEQIQKNPLLRGVTFSGGEPFEQAQVLYELGKQIKQINLNLIVYTGYTLEKLKEKSIKNEHINKLLEITDYLVDGKYDKTLSSYELKFKGSSNQRIIDMKKSMEQQKIVLADF